MDQYFFSRDFPIPARYYAALRDVLRAKGVDDTPVWRRSGIKHERLSVPDAGVSLAEVERIVEALCEMGEASVALSLGRRIRLSKLSLLGYAILASPTIDYAIRVTSRYFPLIFSAMQMQYRVSGNRAEMIVTPTRAMSPECLTFHIEMLSVTAYVDIDELAHEDDLAYELTTSIARPPHADKYAAVMPKAQVLFESRDAPGYSLAFPRSIVSSEPVMADPVSLAVAEQRCREVVARLVSHRHLGEYVTMIMGQSQGAVPSQQELASRLHMSTRTLHRQLRREGLSYRRLYAAEQHRRAARLLANPSLNLTRIAVELGYSDVSNFIRAFRSQAGMSPAEFRHRHLA